MKRHNDIHIAVLLFIFPVFFTLLFYATRKIFPTSSVSTSLIVSGVCSVTCLIVGIVCLAKLQKK